MESHKVFNSKKKELFNLLDSLSFLPNVLVTIVIAYCRRREWESTSVQIWKKENGPSGIVSYQRQLYTCFWKYPSVFTISNIDGEIIKKVQTLEAPFAIDIDQQNVLFYIACYNQINILNVKFEIVSSWKYPLKLSSWNYYRGIKYDNNFIYLTTYEHHYIFVFNCFTGTISHQWGINVPSSAPGNFNRPLGLTVNHKYVYVCDCSNSRIQLLTKEGNFYNQWGGKYQKQQEETKRLFIQEPNYIYHEIEDDIFYVGDQSSVQLFERDETGSGTLIQRIENGNEKFNAVYGICVYEDRLFVCENSTNRIYVFKSLNKNV